MHRTFVWLAVLAIGVAIGGGGCGDDDGEPAPQTGDGDGDGDPPAPGDWFELPAVPDGPIQETAAVALDGKVYVLGGFDQNATVVRTVHAFDTVAGTWSETRPLPRAVHHANAVAADGKIFVLGALEGPRFIPTGVVWAYDPTTDTWDEGLTPMSEGEERGSSFVGVIDGTIYIAGGLQGPAATALFSSYDIAGDEWNDDLPDLPDIRDHGAFGVVDGVLYAIGGRRGGIATVEDTVFAFDPAVGEWQSRAPMPTARGGVAAAVVGDAIVVAGGEGSSVDPGGVFPEVEAYRPALDEWQALEAMRTPRHGMGAAATGDVFYTPGGATSQAFGAVDTHEALVVEF